MALLQTERFLIQVRQILLLKYVNLWQRKQMPNTYDNVKLDFLFIADHILAFPSHNNMDSEVKNLYLNFKQIA